jgi:hypothetical protein
MGKDKNAYRRLAGKSEGQDIGRLIILRWILEIPDVVVWTGLFWLRIGDLWRGLVNMVINFQVP